MLTAASGLCFIASRKMVGRNLVTQIRTFGPTNLSITILLRTSALFSLIIIIVTKYPTLHTISYL